MDMKKSQKTKGLFVTAPEDGAIIDGMQEYRVVYAIDVRAPNPKDACAEAIKILSDQVNCFGKPGTFPPVFQVINSKGKVETVDFEE
jgi:hypothetical protein